jgi:hypothetical protein
MIKFWSVAIFVTLLGCSQKSFEKSTQSEVVDDLNAGNPKAVIQRIDPATASDDEKFYLASAHAMEGKLDVLSVYPLLNMYLFNKAATDWDDLSDVKDPYRKFLNTMDRSAGNTRERRLEIWKQNDDVIRRRFSMDEQIPQCPELYSGNFNQAFMDTLLAHYREELRLMEADPARFETTGIVHTSTWSSTNEEEVRECQDAIYEYFEDHAEYHYQRWVFIEGRVRDGDVASGEEPNWQALIMELLWRTYEAVPFLQRIPALSVAEQENVTKALGLMMELRTNRRYRPRVMKSVLYWSTLSILSVYKSGFDLDRVSSMQEMYCGFSMSKPLEHYQVLRQRLKLLHTLYLEAKDDPSSEAQELGRYVEKLNDAMATLPEELTPEEKASYQERFRETQVNNCVLNQ